MSRYSPFQRACTAGFAIFLLALLLLWFLTLGEPLPFWTLAWFALKIGVLAGIAVWFITSITELRYQVAALRSEVERLKNKE